MSHLSHTINCKYEFGIMVLVNLLCTHMHLGVRLFNSLYVSTALLYVEWLQVEISISQNYFVFQSLKIV